MDKRVKGIKAKNSAKTVKREGRTKESLIFFVHSSFPTDCVSKMGLKTNTIFCKTANLLDIMLPISFSYMSHIPKRSSNSVAVSLMI